nr:hypothetical protein [Pandoravirus massiliensis]
MSDDEAAISPTGTAAVSATALPEPALFAVGHSTVGSDYVSQTIHRAAELVTQAYADCKTRYVKKFLACPFARAADGITDISLDDKVLYAGEPITAKDISHDIIDCIAQQDTALSQKLLRVNGRRILFNRKFGGLCYETYGGPWLHSALRGDDAAHCALIIAATVGKPEWALFANTATNLRTGQTCPRIARLARILTDVREDDYDDETSLEVACDAAVLCDILCSLRTTATAASGNAVEIADDSPKLVIVADECGAGAVCIGPDAWRFGRARRDKTVVDTGAVMTTRGVAWALAKARACPSGADTMNVYDDRGSRIARLPSVGQLLHDEIDGAALDASPKHRRALDLARSLMRGLVERCTHMAAMVVDAHGSDAYVPLSNDSAVRSLDDLRHMLQCEDIARLRRCLGTLWDMPGVGCAILAQGATYTADDHGIWHDTRGRVVSWDEFARSTQTCYNSVAPTLSSPMSWYRMPDVKSRRAHRNPCHAPDLAYGLCRDALGGDARAANWLRVLSITSPKWATIHSTIGNVASWIAAGCPSTSSDDGGSLWSEPLIDWVLDVPVHGDIGEHFDTAQEAFNAAAVDALVSKGHSCAPCATLDNPTDRYRYGICACASIRKGDTHKQAICSWKTNWRMLVDKRTEAPYYVDTYLGATARCLTRTPLQVDGRQILAVETFCPLLGDVAAGIEALVRALYTCEPVRTRVIAPMQLALAERTVPLSPV